MAGRIANLEDKSLEVHTQLAKQLAKSTLDQVYTTGPEIGRVVPALGSKFGGHYEKQSVLIQQLAKHIDQDQVLFIKGSSRDSQINKLTMRFTQQVDYFANRADEFDSTLISHQSNAYTQQGVGRLLVILEILERLTTNSLNMRDLVTITHTSAQEKSGIKLGLKIGDRYTLQELLMLAIVAPVPDIILSLAEFVYGSNRAAATGIRAKAKALNLSAQAVVNITGRPTRQPQRTYLKDVEKIGSAFVKLPNEFFSLLNTQRVQFSGNFQNYQKKSQLLKTGKAAGSIFFGSSETNGLIFFNDQPDKRFIAFINAPHSSYIDAKIEQFVDGGSPAVTAKANVEHVKLQQPIINLLSDTYFGEMYTRARKRQHINDALQKYGYGHSFEKLGAFFTESSYNIFNFEAVFAEGPSALAGIKPFVLDAKLEPTIQELKKRHLNLAMLGNNHAKDAGALALTNSVCAFHKAGISTIGAGADLSDSRRFIEFEYNGQKVALFNGYWYRNQAYNLFDFYAKTESAGVNCLDTLVWEDVREYRQQNPTAKIIVNAHWGNDFHEGILPAQRGTAEKLVSAGADLIIGHGPHILQPIEYVGHTPIIYSIGNGVFNNNGEFVKRGCLAYGATVRLNLMQDKLYLCPFYANNRETFWQPDFVNDEDFKEAAGVFGSQYLTTKLDDLNAVVVPF